MKIKFAEDFDEDLFDNQETDEFDYFLSRGIIAAKGPVLKQGKEASVYYCPGTEPSASPVALKIYKDIGTRSFKAVSKYLEGRLEEAGMSRRDRMHLMSSPRDLHCFWIQSEFHNMQLLYEQGLPVPCPLAANGMALAMEMIMEGEEPAPRLKDARIPKEDLPRLQKTLLTAIEKMLSLDLIHGDLSCYNILYEQGRPVIIDFPQMINARYHSEGKTMLERDIRNVLIFCKTQDAQGKAWRMAERLWKNYNGCNFF